MRAAAILIAVLVLVSSPTGYALTIGDKAPPVKASTWYNGDAVNPAEPDGKTIYVVEFWATWCPPCKASIPHLNELQQQLKDKNVVILGISDEPETKVEPFIKKMKMEYLAASDPKRETHDAYLEGVPGIPHAFVVGTNGIVLWSGHPLDGLSEALEGIVAGTFDPAAEQHRQTARKELETVLRAGDVEKAMAKVDELIAREKDIQYYQVKLSLLAETGDRDGVDKLYGEMLSVFTDSAEDLNVLAWATATAPFDYRDLDVAWKAVSRAAELSKREEPAIPDTLARVQYSLGMLTEAIATQAEAVEKSGDDEQKKDLEGTLEYYKKALGVCESIRKGKE
jgi:peroxiredoxin